MKNHILQNETELAEFTKKYKRIIVQFSAQWCGPCRKITPELTEYINKIERDDVIYVYCDVDIVGEISDKFGVKSIPCFICYIQEDNIWTEELVSCDLNKVLEYYKTHGALEK